MPKGDHTGPMGAGAKSGRAAGFCAGFGRPGFTNRTMTGNPGPVMYRNRGRWCAGSAGRGGRRWWGFAADRPGRRYLADYPMTAQPVGPESEKEALKNRSLALQAELETVNKQLKKIDDQDKMPLQPDKPS